MEAEREHGREVQVLVFVSSSAMDSSASFTRQRFRPPFPNPRAWGGRGEVGDSRRLATSADCSAGKEIDGRSEEDERGVGGYGAERLGVVGVVEESQEARGAPLV